MSEEKIKSLTVQKLPESQIEIFHQERKRFSPEKTPAQYFSLLLENALSGGVNTETEEKLTAALTKITELEKRIVYLDSVIAENESKPPLEVEKKLTGTQFIFEPKDETFKNMKRSIYYLIKEQKVKKDAPDLVENFTEKAVTYYIKNEFSHILK